MTDKTERTPEQIIRDQIGYLESLKANAPATALHERIEIARAIADLAQQLPPTPTGRVAAQPEAERELYFSDQDMIVGLLNAVGALAKRLTGEEMAVKVTKPGAGGIWFALGDNVRWEAAEVPGDAAPAERPASPEQPS